jgi:hypothetical protein
MRHRTVTAQALAGALGACSDPALQSTGPAAPEPVLIRDANNYRATSTLSITSVETASAVDLDICWSELRSDLLCHPVAPDTEIDNVAMLRVARLSEAEIEAQLAADDLKQSSVDGYADYPTSDGVTCTRLSSFSFFDTDIDLEENYAPSDGRNYLLLFTTGTALGVGARSMLFLKPTADSDRVRVDAPSGCGALEFAADLAAAEPLVLPARGPWLLDWRELVHNGLGNEALPNAIDRALLGFYAQRTLSDLEDGIFDLQTLATELYAIELAGERETDLSFAREATTGAPFAGFERERDGIWLFGLLCGTCRNPAPVLLSPVLPDEEEV